MQGVRKRHSDARSLERAMQCGFWMVLVGEIEEAALFSFASYELR